MVNPVAVAELFSQLRSISVLEAAVAVNSSGAAKGVAALAVLVLAELPTALLA